jgi:hypothetical protein
MRLVVHCGGLGLRSMYISATTTVADIKASLQASEGVRRAGCARWLRVAAGVARRRRRRHSSI